MLAILLAAAVGITTPVLAEDKRDKVSIPKPEALIADGMPALPATLLKETAAYRAIRSAASVGWNPEDGSMLISTRFAGTPQIHSVPSPGARRTQITFEDEPIVGANWSPQGDTLVVQKDSRGDEFFQLYRVVDGTLTLLTDGNSRNLLHGWSPDGKLIAYSSTARNGRDNDIWLMDPRDPSTARMAGQVKGGGWKLVAFLPDGSGGVLANSKSVADVDLHVLDFKSGKMRQIGDPKAEIAFGNDPDWGIAFGTGGFDAKGRFWTNSNTDSEFMRLGTLDLKTGVFIPRGPQPNWDIEGFSIAPDGKTIAYVWNAAGVSRVGLYDTDSGIIREVEALPRGFVSSLSIAKDGRIAITFESARGPADAWVVDPETLALTRWTYSETGGLNFSDNSQPELITIESFDGTEMSGFLYRPDAERFPGPRPLIVDVHGGPEYQSRARFRAYDHYYLDRLGVALFYPNVRGSTGYGRTFGTLDDGPFKREDSVRDIGAFLDVLENDERLDMDRAGLRGASYGGYMCYASAVAYADRLRATNCIVAISNFVTFLENTQSYRRDLRRVEYGDERDPLQRAKLLEISPSSRVNEMTNPMFIVTGKNDARVPASEAQVIIDGVRKNDTLAWHLIAANEGHGFMRKENRDYQFAASVAFWQKTLLKKDISAKGVKSPYAFWTDPAKR